LPAAEGEQMTRKWVLLEHCLDQDGQAVKALPHVGVTERQMDLHAGRNDQHLVFSSCCAMYRRTASRSLPPGANARRPSASSTATVPGGIGRMSCRTATALLLPRSSAIPTATRLADLLLPKPSSARHRNSTLVTIPCARATCETVAPRCSVSST